MKLRKKYSSKRLQLTVLILSMLAIMMALGFAWYTFYKKHADTTKLDIMTPYSLFLLNSGATDTLELSIGGMHPNETKQIVVCVSSHDKNAQATSKEGNFPYTLALMHTDNMGLSYRVYPLTPLDTAPGNPDENTITSDYTVINGEQMEVKTAYFSKGNRLTENADKNQTKNQEYRQDMYGGLYESDTYTEDSIVNQGTYHIYEEDNFQLSLSDEKNKYNYFLIEIEWGTGDAATDEKSKETDLIYLVAKAGVPKPIEIENTIP